MKGHSSLWDNYSASIVETKSDSPLQGNSQPFQELYHVYEKMRLMDEKNGVYDYSKGGYLVNPTSGLLDSFINNGYIVNKNYKASMPYVITNENEIIIGKRNGRRDMPTPHPTLIGGIDPQVKMAGMLHIENGKIVSYDDRSGHYRPNKASLKYADDAFNKYNYLKKGNE